MAFETEFTMQGFFLSQPDSDGPSTIELHLNRKHCLRVFRRTHDGVLPPIEDETIDSSRCLQLGFSSNLLSEFKHQIWIFISSLDFPLSLCSFLHCQITSFVIDFAAESPSRPFPSLVLVADVKFVQTLDVDYTHRNLDLMQPRNENLILGSSTEVPKVDSYGFVGETEEINCCVCMEGVSEGQKVMTMECKHSYHEECILNWLIQNPTCALCRRPIYTSPRSAAVNLSR